MLSSRRGASPLTMRSTLIDTVVHGRRSRRSCSRFSATKKRGPMLGLTPNGPCKKIRRWSLGRLGRVDLYFERDITDLLGEKILHFWTNGKSVYETDPFICLE